MRLNNHTGCICLASLRCVQTHAASFGLHCGIYKHNENICLTFPECDLSCELSNLMPEKMQNHTGCIYAASHRYVLTCAPSSPLPEPMQSYIGYIYWVLHQWGCLHVFLSCWRYLMHNHTGSICVVFRHYASLNVASNFYYEMFESCRICICKPFLSNSFASVSLSAFSNWHRALMQSHIGCICKTFLPYVSSNAFLGYQLERMKITLVAHIGPFFMESLKGRFFWDWVCTFSSVIHDQLKILSSLCFFKLRSNISNVTACERESKKKPFRSNLWQYHKNR